MLKHLCFQLSLWMLATTITAAQHLTSYRDAGRVGINVTDHMLLQDSRRAMDGPSTEKIEGSPYLSETFVTGDVYTNKGIHPAIPLRYNIYEDLIEFTSNDITYILDPGPNVRKVDFGGYSFVVEKPEVNGKSGYYALLDSGKVTLLAKRTLTFREAQPPKPLETEGKLARYSKAPDKYYYKIGNGPLIDISSIKKMIESLPDNHDELKQFASQEKISPKNEDELIKLVKYYNTL